MIKYLNTLDNMNYELFIQKTLHDSTIGNESTFDPVLYLRNKRFNNLPKKNHNAFL